MLIIICGLPGSGKTTLARALSNKLKAVHISSDIVRKRMFTRPGYGEEEKRAVYGEMEAEASGALGEGKTVVVDATFYQGALRERFMKIAENNGRKAALVLCVLAEEEVRRRLGRRKEGGPSDADFAIYLKMKESFEPIAGEHLVVESSHPLRRRIERIRKYIGV
jgi:hypothetical protein